MSTNSKIHKRCLSAFVSLSGSKMTFCVSKAARLLCMPVFTTLPMHPKHIDLIPRIAESIHRLFRLLTG